MTTSDHGPLPKIHPRVFVQEIARRELDAALVDIVKKHKLTSAEEYDLLATALHRHATSLISIERRTKKDE